MQVHVLEEKKNQLNAAASMFVNMYSAAYTQKSADIPVAVGHVSSKPRVTTSGTLGPQLPSPSPTVLLHALSNAPSHSPSPGSQLIWRSSTKLPAVVKFSFSCTTLNHSVHPTLVWRRGSPPIPAASPSASPTSHCPSEAESPSHSSPSSSKVKFNYWVI